MSSASTAARDEYTSERHVYEPHRAGLPPFGPYFRELWRRRGFAFELARTQMHAANTDTVFGQAWLILNPLLLSLVYLLLQTVLTGKNPSGSGFATLTCGLFLYYYITGSLQSGTTSITQGGRLILNTPFPKMLLTISTTYTAFRRYLPTLLVYLVVHLIARLPIGFHLLWMIPILFLATLMGQGLANLFATLQVYFRDTASFLPYFIRIWLYLSPVLWTPDMVKGHYKLLEQFGWLNPIYGILGAQGEVLVGGHRPAWNLLGLALAWSVTIMVAGSLLMMSREREFAVRL